MFFSDILGNFQQSSGFFFRISVNMFCDSLSLFVNLTCHSDVAHISDESEKLLSLG